VASAIHAGAARRACVQSIAPSRYVFVRCAPTLRG